MGGCGKFCLLLILVLASALSAAWKNDRRDTHELREMRRPGVHYHSKRHMLASEPEKKKRFERTTPKPPRELRKKPSGHLIPLEEDDIENDEVVSVAIGPPPIRPKFEKHRKQSTKQTNIISQASNSSAVNLVREVLTQLGREFLIRDVNENFVFGQYVGNAMRNLTNELRLRMQHDILDLILKYQKLNSTDVKREEQMLEKKEEARTENSDKIERKLVNIGMNDTDESWPDFTNLAKIVG